ncbi:MAG: hypothetical protein HY763_14680 [Planctomycetes bacterium]|nr:hypothetical protein [Planctomycetota bacterium]
MPSKQRPTDDRRPEPDGIDLPYWLQLVRDLPDLRLAKVTASRRALRAGRYESEQVLEAAIDRMEADLGVVFAADTCR